MKLGKRKCKQCGETFQKVKPLQFLCGYSCWRAHIAEEARKEADKKWQEDRKVYEWNTTTLPQWKKKLEKEINLMVRRIDYGNTCMMCDKPIKKVNACHYHGVGSNDALRFNLFNIWAGCYSCNGNKGGNIIGYDMMLIQKAGKENWEYIKFQLVKDYPLLKLSREDIRDLIPKVHKLAIEIEAVKRSTMERWMLRKELNDKIGIYK